MMLWQQNSVFAGALLTVAIITLQTVLGFDPVRFPGPYCARREPKCCPGRDDQCTVPIHDTLCYCDEFCYKHNVEDCCPDYKPVCTQGSLDSDCTWRGRQYQPGETYTNDCNSCTCVREAGSYGKDKHTWSCTNDACINEKNLIDRINDNPSYGWRAKAYSKFDGEKLSDGIRYYLGTINPKPDVLRQYSINVKPEVIIPRWFDANNVWKGYIHAARDQGRCASSWVFSSISVASDRWAIDSEGVFNFQLSQQQLLDCNRYTSACDGGRVEDAWWWLQKEGVVQEYCYPYLSGTTGKKERCLTRQETKCSSEEVQHILKMTPAYRISSNETEIMYEIMTRGPVQAIIQVRADFFLYERGIYRYTREPEYLRERDHSLTGTHSVKITGWGEENGVKYWTAVNSWGTGWGDNGTFKIAKGENESGIEDFIVGVWARVEQHEVKNERKHRHAHKI